MKHTIQIFFIGAALFLTVFSCKKEKIDPYAQAVVDYRITFENRTNHEARVEAVFTNIPPDRPLEVVMSRSSPGRYALHEFAKNVYSVSAADAEGNDLTADRVSSNCWVIADHSGQVRFSYSVYGNNIDGTHSSISIDHVLLNMPSVFVWARRLEKSPVTLKVVKPDPAWKSVTQLKYDKSEDLYRAGTRDYFMDSPLLMGDLAIRTWQMESGGRTTDFTYALFHRGNESDVTEFADNIPLIIREQEAIFGQLPAFDENRYTFLHIYNPLAVVDGMEHRNSSVLTQFNPLRIRKRKFLVGTSHEFFHAWNVMRLKPASLQAFDFEGQNMCGQLWFIEGSAVYYDSLFILRAGIIDFNLFVYNMTLHLDRVLRSPYKQYKSPVQISKSSVLLDGAEYEDHTNNGNVYLTHYDVGDILMMGLDLTLRIEFPGISLDDYMMLLWEKFGNEEIPYTDADLINTLAELTGNPEFAGDFFARYIFGKELPDYKKLLGHAGILVKKKYKNAASIGDVLMQSTGTSCRIIENTPAGSPLYKAGLDLEDKILSLAGRRTYNVSRLYQILRTLQPGMKVNIVYDRGGLVVKKKIVIEADQEIVTVTYESAGLKVTDKIKAFRESWIKSKYKENE